MDSCSGRTACYVIMFSKEFTKLVVVAAIIAFPLAYYLTHRWLQDFAYRVDINPMLFVFAGVSVLLLAWLSVGYQSIKAATSNPVDALRYE